MSGLRETIIKARAACFEHLVNSTYDFLMKLKDSLLLGYRENHLAESWACKTLGCNELLEGNTPFALM